MYKSIIISLFTLFIFSCKNNKQPAREPIQYNQGGADMKSVELNRNLNKREEDYILKMIQKDSLHKYYNSGHGFWYYYIQKKDDSQIYPETDDLVTLTYEIKDLSGNAIYTQKEIGEKKYHVDHENYFRGFHYAVKLLKEGEEALFIFPSNSAYGYHGDEKKIGQNIPLQVKIHIIKIEKNKQ
jgi:gliding motility-associated peptidyl-prolyl isomerase